MAEAEPGLGSRSSGGGAITIDELLALNAEIAALVRAGIPLERGLIVAGRDLKGRLERVAAALAQRLDRGESLHDALGRESASIPPLYRAVVEAGARSGQLPIALEGMARYVRGYSEARAAIGVALWYPLLVLSLAYAASSSALCGRGYRASSRLSSCSAWRSPFPSRRSRGSVS